MINEEVDVLKPFTLKDFIFHQGEDSEGGPDDHDDTLDKEEVPDGEMNLLW